VLNLIIPPDSVTAVDHNKSNLLNISKITENKNISKTMVTAEYNKLFM